uniref:C2H2-type domain-containing protein n=1 Tax=Amphiprion percula TaxID=161767 RepID=A0A3P8RWK0_AMPPE
MSSSSSSGSGSSSSGYPQFLRPFHPAEAALAQEQLHSGMGRFDFGGSSSGGSAGVIGGVVAPAPPPPPLHPGLSVAQRRSPAPPGDGSERPYGCQICGKRFRRAETLRRHNRVHTGEKPHACDVCGKMFREPFHLTKHLTVHSGQKNYKCNLCGKMFAYAQSAAAAISQVVLCTWILRSGELFFPSRLPSGPPGPHMNRHMSPRKFRGEDGNFLVTISAAVAPLHSCITTKQPLDGAI